MVMAQSQPRSRIAICGTGFVGRQLARAVDRAPDLVVSAVLTRRPVAQVADYPNPSRLTRSLEVFVRDTDLVVECSGDPFFAFHVVEAAFEAGLPVITMNSEFQVTVGSHFAAAGYLSEAEGDQPGCLAAFAEDATEMGFTPVVFGNMKGFLNVDPSPATMALWGERKGISLSRVTSFTDGTKLQIEQALVANGLGAGVAKRGMMGLPGANPRAAMEELGRVALAEGRPLVDYVLGSELPPGVFITAIHDEAETGALDSFKLGAGPLYVLERPFHVCGLEIPKTIRRALRGDKPLLNNTARPRFSVAAIAKRHLRAGCTIKQGIGGFDVRGEIVEAVGTPGHVPIGALCDATITRDVHAGEILQWADVEVPDSAPLQACRRLFP